MEKLKEYECTKCGRRFESKPADSCRACNDPNVREITPARKK